MWNPNNPKYQPPCSVDVVLAAVGRAALWAASSQAPGPVASTVPMPDRKSGTPAAVLMPAHEGNMGARAGEGGISADFNPKKIQRFQTIMSNQGYQTTTCTTPSPIIRRPHPTPHIMSTPQSFRIPMRWGIGWVGVGEAGHAEQRMRGEESV